MIVSVGPGQVTECKIAWLTCIKLPHSDHEVTMVERGDDLCGYEAKVIWIES